MLSYIEKRTISNDCGKIFQNYFVPFLCLLKCASFSGNTSWASSYGAWEQCEFIIKNFVKVPINSFNDFMDRFGFRWDSVTRKFIVSPFYRDYEITLEDLDISDESKKNVAVSTLLDRIHKNSEILSTRYLSSRATLILSVISIHMNETSNIFGNNTLDDILLEYVDVLPKKQSVGF
jgi:hypothetical protein